MADDFSEKVKSKKTVNIESKLIKIASYRQYQIGNAFWIFIKNRIKLIEERGRKRCTENKEEMEKTENFLSKEKHWRYTQT